MDPRPTPGGELETTLLRALWDAAPRELTGRQLYETIGRSREVIYTTIAKVLDRLVAKGLIARTRRGTRYAYRPSVEQAPTQRAMVRASLTHIFGEDPRPAMASLIGALEEVSPALLDELGAALAARKREADATDLRADAPAHKGRADET